LNLLRKFQSKTKKIDGIIATVGDFIILDSDIDKSYLELSSQGNSVKDITRCQMLGKLLEDKLYAHQAIQDSVKVTDAEVKE
jgi:peptidyl-prolyl cis-trans isomerase SurA